MSIAIIDEKNKTVKNVNLEIDVNLEINEKLLFHYNKYVLNKFRYSTASTKTWSQVKCSTAKAYKQKGTGNARRGANSTPLRRGGGVIFGPSPREFSLKLNIHH